MGCCEKILSGPLYSLAAPFAAIDTTGRALCCGDTGHEEQEEKDKVAFYKLPEVLCEALPQVSCIIPRSLSCLLYLQ